MLISKKKGERERGEKSSFILELSTELQMGAIPGSFILIARVTIRAGLPGIVLAYACDQHKY